jgi:hypothetical protein
MQKGIVRKVTAVVFCAGEKKIEKYVVVVVADCQHQRSSSEIVWFYCYAFLEKSLHYVFLSSGCSQMQNVHTLFGLYVLIN